MGEEAKVVADNEAKERVSLLGKYRNLEHSADGLKENYEEEVSAKENLARQLDKALGDAEMYRQKYEQDGVAKAEELEMAKLKMQARLAENNAVIEQLELKLSQLEKGKAKQIEEAEEIAALNLAKYRTVQANLSGINEAADHAEQELAKSRARAKSSS